MTESEQRVSQFYHRLAAWCVLRQAVAAVTLWAFAWGTGVLVLRAALGTPAVPLLWGAAGVPIAVALAAWIALRRLPDRAAVRALLDRHAECGGLLMAGADRDLGRWRENVPAIELPALRWRARRPLGLLAVAVGYVLLSFLLPSRVAALVGNSPLDVTREADRLAEQVRVLKEEKILEPERAEVLKQKLDELRQQTTGKDPAKTLEALDHLNDVLRQAARKSAESAARQSNQADQVGTAADALQAAATDLRPEDAAELMKELATLAKKAAAENEQLKEELDPELAEALENGTLSPQQLSKLAAAAKAGKASARKLAKQLYDAKLIDADMLKQCEGEGKCNAQALAEFLKKNGCKGGLCEAMGNLPGKGGVNEGPGAAELQFGDKSTADGAKFREEALPPSDLAALKESQLAGVSKATPQKDAKAVPPGAGALRGAAAGGGSANTPAVLPQHRGAVGRYFDRPAK